MAEEAIVSQEIPAPDVNADAPLKEAALTPEPVKETALDKMQKRIDELTWRLRDNERRAQPAPMEPPVKAEPKVPRLEDFQFDEAKFQAAQTEYLRAETARLVSEGLAKARQEQEAAVMRETFDEQQVAFAAKTPDYDEKVYAGIDGRPGLEVPISTAMADEIRSSERGAEIAYFLATHRDVAMQLYQLPERQVAREIGKIEARLPALAATKAAAPVVPKVTQAPPPPAKIEAEEPGAPIDISDPKISDAQFAKVRRRQIAQRK